jgi:CHAD domain-containing protein
VGRKAQRHKVAVLMRDHVAGQMSTLLRRLAFQANQTAHHHDAGAVHDLRVSIRRLSQCLRVFGQFFPRERGRKSQHRLNAVMDLASAVRDRDIAMEFLTAARIPSDSALVQVLSQERAAAERSLVDTLERWSRRSFQKKWRSRLEL